LTWPDDERKLVFAVTAGLVTGIVVATIDSAFGGMKAGFAGVHNSLDASADSWDSHTKTAPTVAVVAHTLAFLDRAIEVKSPRRVNSIVVFRKWEGRDAAWWRLLP
jgi:hypothetical protein